MRMKSLTYFIASILAVLIYFNTAGPAEAAQTYNLTYSTSFAPKYLYLMKPMEDFAKNVEKRTNGNIKIEIYPSAQLFKAKEEMMACARGDVDLVTPTDLYCTGIIPAMGISGLPFLFRDAVSMQKALHEGLWEFGVKQDLLKHNLVYLGVACAGGYQIYSKNPVTRPDQFEGKIWGVSGSTASKICEILGGSPTTLSSTELYLALQRGLIDGCTRPFVTGVGRKLDEVIKNVTETNMYFCNTFLVINKDVWDDMPEEYRKVLKECAAERDAENLRMLVEYEKGVVNLFESKGVTVNNLTKDQFKVFQDMVQPVYDWWLEQVPNGRQYIEFARKYH